MIIQNLSPDPLSDVLSMAGLRAECSVRLRASGQWALRFRPIELKFNVVRQGGCWLRMENLPAQRLQAGDCFVVCRTPFVLSSDPELEAVDASEVFAHSSSSASIGDGNDVELLGGSVSLVSQGGNEFLAILPPSIIIAAASEGASSFAWLLDELDKEWSSAQAGGYAMCNDLLRLIFIHALRHHITATDVEKLGWVAGLRDPIIANVMRAIHGAPEKPWKLAQLAAIACMSRSGFASLFKARVGRSPVEYATHWRMQVAASRLNSGKDSVGAVAASLGYLSDTAFIVAFRRVHGKSPAKYRRDMSQG